MKIQNKNETQLPLDSQAHSKSAFSQSSKQTGQQETALLDHTAKLSQLDDESVKTSSLTRLSPSQLHDLKCVVGEKNALFSIKSLKGPNIGYRVHKADAEDAQQHFQAKTLVLKNKKTGESVAFVLSMDKQIDTKSDYFKSAIPGRKHCLLNNVEQRTGFVPGGVNPMIKNMDVHVDKSVTDNDRFVIGGGSPKKIMVVDSAILEHLPGKNLRW